MRDKKNYSKRHMKIQSVLEVFKGMSSITNIKARKKKVLISHMRKDDGEIAAWRNSISNTFDKFYASQNAKDISEEKVKSLPSTQTCHDERRKTR